MTKVLVEDTNLTNIANAIRNKNGSTTKYKPREMPNAINNISTGININGIIKEYVVSADGNVNAGDFVTFVQGKSNDTMLDSISSSGFAISPIQLSNNRIFIAHSSDSTNFYLYGMICTISENDIIVNSNIQLSADVQSGSYISAVSLSNDKIFIAHGRSQLYGMVCTISGTTITKNTDIQLSDGRYSGWGISAVALNENKVFIAHNKDSYYLYGIICNISGTNITYGTDTQLSTIQANYLEMVVFLSNDKVFIAYETYSSYPYGVVCDISGTNITYGTSISLSSSYPSGNYLSAVALNESKVIIAYSVGSYYRLYGLICTISGTTITKSTNIQLSVEDYSSYCYLSMVKLSNDKIFIAHGNDKNYYLHGMMCTIFGTNIIVDFDIELSDTINSGYVTSVVALNENKVFCLHSNTKNNYLCGIICVLDTAKTVTLSNETINGIAKTSGTPNKAIEVYIPNI